MTIEQCKIEDTVNALKEVMDNLNPNDKLEFLNNTGSFEDPDGWEAKLYESIKMGLSI